MLRSASLNSAAVAFLSPFLVARLVAGQEATASLASHSLLAAAAAALVVLEGSVVEVLAGASLAFPSHLAVVPAEDQAVVFLSLSRAVLLAVALAVPAVASRASHSRQAAAPAEDLTAACPSQFPVVHPVALGVRAAASLASLSPAVVPMEGPAGVLEADSLASHSLAVAQVQAQDPVETLAALRFPSRPAVPALLPRLPRAALPQLPRRPLPTLASSTTSKCHHEFRLPNILDRDARSEHET